MKINQIPSHLRKYTVPQNYKKYTPEDQAVWRFIMKGISYNLSFYGHKGALEGFKETGISSKKIPKISDISKKLKKFGWGAACISGFIPPRAFMEFQKYKILPIASELRVIDHIFYTPAPDIVHEAVGHVPFLTNKDFSKFLENYASTVLKSISSKEDMDRYEAIRILSDLKEKPGVRQSQIKKAEKKLEEVVKNISYVSESAKLSRLIWWTSEYGLIGTPKNPKIYGAGLISSIGEGAHIKKTKTLPLTKKCLDYSFDITDYQPQLFVCKNFKQLQKILDEVLKDLSFKRGGEKGVKEALKAQTLNTVELNSGLQISGVLERMESEKRKPCFLKFKGPVQLGFKGKQLKGHGRKRHGHGYSTPLGFVSKKKLHLFKSEDLKKEGLEKGKTVKMKFKGGITLKGKLKDFLYEKNRLLVLTFTDCLIKDKKKEVLYQPSWGEFDLAVGDEVISVFSGLLDPVAYKLKDDFKPSKVPKKTYSKKQKEIFEIYKEIEALKGGKKEISKKLKPLLSKIKGKKGSWLMGLELLDKLKRYPDLKKEVLKSLKDIKKTEVQEKKVFSLGLKFYKL